MSSKKNVRDPDFRLAFCSRFCSATQGICVYLYLSHPQLALKTCRSCLVEMKTKTYLHETVTSILVAGTLVLRGSNCPIDANIATAEVFSVSCLPQV